MKQSAIFLYALILLVSLHPLQAAESCVKMVFEDYCLGGSMKQQLETHPIKMKPQVHGERQGVIYQTENEKVYVMAFKGIIYKVLHTFEPATQSTLLDLRRRLQRKYGSYQDLSEYPEETKNKSRRMSFIRRGEGELKNTWQPQGQHWRVELGWSRKLGVHVAYYINELDQLQKAEALKGL